MARILKECIGLSIATTDQALYYSVGLKAPLAGLVVTQVADVFCVGSIAFNKNDHFCWRQQLVQNQERLLLFHFLSY